MRDGPSAKLKAMRQKHPTLGGSPDGAMFGFFEGRGLRIISSGQDHWEHVSVSRPDRCPTWDEMCWVKKLFWHDEETVLQFHPPKSVHINNHRFCLHLWKPAFVEVELPPAILVGV